MTPVNCHRTKTSDWYIYIYGVYIYIYGVYIYMVYICGIYIYGIHIYIYMIYTYMFLHISLKKKKHVVVQQTNHGICCFVASNSGPSSEPSLEDHPRRK